MTGVSSSGDRIDLTPGVTATYFVLVSTAAPGATGAYTLTVQGYGPAPNRP